MVVLGGPAILALPMLVPRIEAVVRQRAFWVAAPSVGVLASQLGKNAVAIGAAAYLLSHSSIVAPDAGDSFAPTSAMLPAVSAAPRPPEAETYPLPAALARETTLVP